MRDNLPKTIRNTECAIINLDEQSNPGSHWTAYVKIKTNIKYFDSFGNLRPPIELVGYFNSDGGDNVISYNHERVQLQNTYNCGHLCLKFLIQNSYRA